MKRIKAVRLSVRECHEIIALAAGFSKDAFVEFVSVPPTSAFDAPTTAYAQVSEEEVPA